MLAPRPFCEDAGPKVGVPLSGSAAPSPSRGLSIQTRSKYFTSGLWGLKPEQMWCATSGCSGLIWIEVIQVSWVKPVGTVTEVHSITLFLGLAGTSVTGPSMMTSG